MTTRGLVALGDSITVGRTEPMLGVHPQSWAQWLAEALELPVTILARNGARAQDVGAEQVPRLRGPYDLACVYVGVNDARSSTGTPRRTSASWHGSSMRRPARPSACSCARSRRTSGARARRRSPRRRARSCAGWPRGRGAVVVDLGDFGGETLVLPDAVHPTARGEVAIADRAALALRAAGVQVARLPSELLEKPAPGVRARARWRWRYGVLAAKDALRRAKERVLPPSP